VASIVGAESPSLGPDYFVRLRANATTPGVPSPLRPEWGPLTQRLVFFPFPAEPWIIAPPALASFLDDLRGCAGGGGGGARPSFPVTALVSFAFARPGPTGFRDVGGTGSATLRPPDCAALVEAIVEGADGGQSGSRSSPVALPGILPLVVRLPATAGLSGLGRATRTLQLQLQVAPNASASRSPILRTAAPVWWWELSVSPLDPFGPGPSAGTPGVDGPVLHTVSDRVAPSFLATALGSYSIIAVYVGVVLAVGRLVRGALGSPTHRIPFEELPDSTLVLGLCEGITATRAARYEGHLVDEAHLYRVLIAILRRPDVLARLTRGRKAE
jgi:hypothetical protein